MSVEKKKKESMQKHLLPLMRARWSLVCSVKTDPSRLIWNEETAEEKWSVSNKRWKRQEVVPCFRQSPCQWWWCWYSEGQREADYEMRSRRGRGRPNLGGSLREENSQTKVHEAGLRTGDGVKDEKQLHIIAYTLWYDTCAHLNTERSLQGQTGGRM